MADLLGSIIGEMDRNAQQAREGKIPVIQPATPTVIPSPKPTKSPRTTTTASFMDALALAETLEDPSSDSAAVPHAKKPKKKPAVAAAVVSEPKTHQETAPDLALDAKYLGWFTLVETPEQCAQALERIRNSGSSVVFCDCEGVSLGRNGRLCLVQVCTVHRESFLFDVADPVVMAATMDAGLRELLESRSVVKVFHDCRSDSDALWHCARVKLQNVFDTQVAHAVLTRQNSGSRGAPIPAALATVITRYGKGLTHESKTAMHAAMDADKDFWTHRPLPVDALLYASSDVLLLLAVHKSLVTNLTAQDLKFVAKFSEQYAAQIRDNADGKRISGGIDGDVPLYGIHEFDIEVMRMVDQLKKKGTWQGKRRTLSPAPTASVSPIPMDIVVAAAAAAAPQSTQTDASK